VCAFAFRARACAYVRTYLRFVFGGSEFTFESSAFLLPRTFHLCGWVGAWVRGCVGAWVRECVGAWVGGWI